MSVTARVRLTIDVPSKSSWSETTTMKQIMDQAGRETKQAVENALRERFPSAKFWLKPVVTAIFVSDEDVP